MNQTIPNSTKAGFTLVELLAALAVSAIIASFIVVGLKMSLRSWTMSKDRHAFEERAAAASQLRSLLARTMPVTSLNTKDGLAQLFFEGHSDSLSFVTLSEATAFPGGFMKLRLTWQDQGSHRSQPTNLVLYPSVFRSDQEQETEQAPLILFRNVSALSISYFGATDINHPPDWHLDWVGQTQLPQMVRLTIDILTDKGSDHFVLSLPLRLAPAK